MLTASLAGLVSGQLQRMLETLRYVVDAVIDPLRADEEIKHFTLAIPEAHTTTLEGDTGWSKRPPALLSCPECGGEIYQHRSRSDIECADCYFSADSDEFRELELRTLLCPKCGTAMMDGKRHPQVFEVPEWATCENCRYHWEYATAY